MLFSLFAKLVLGLLLQRATSLSAQDAGVLPSVPTPTDLKPGSILQEGVKTKSQVRD